MNAIMMKPCELKLVPLFYAGLVWSLLDTDDFYCTIMTSLLTKKKKQAKLIAYVYVCMSRPHHLFQCMRKKRAWVRD